MTQENNINQPLKGMNTDVAPDLLNSQDTYTDALNAKQESEDGNSIHLTNEPSTTLSTIIKDYKVIGFKRIEEYNRTIYFLTNPLTGSSEIGYIENNTNGCIDNIDFDKSEIIDCEPCNKNKDYKPIYGESVELSTKTCNEYKTIINANCLNFSINHPIHKVEYKITNKSIEIYWTDNYNPMRWLDLNKIPFIEGTANLDCNQIKVFPDFRVPVIKLLDILDNGSLKTGAYQFFVAYSNSKGEELSQYYAATNPVSIWENELSEDLVYDTNKSIQIEISELDTTFKFFNLAVAKTIGSITSFELVGIYDILRDTLPYLYTGNDKLPKVLTSADIYFRSPFYKKADTVSSQNNLLMWGNLQSDEKINYQSIANKIVLYWESNRVPYNQFEAYNKGTNTANYRSFLRDEVYALEFVPVLKSGKLGPRTHIPGPKGETSYFEQVTNLDAQNFKNNPCDEEEIVPRWKLYNTASKIGFSEEFSGNENNKCYIGPYEYGNFGYYESIRTYPNNKLLWGELAGLPIRHHKMPGVDISPIADSNPFYTDPIRSVNYEHAIYPLGIRVNYQNIIDAIQNSDLTQEQKDDIVGFQILRSTRTNNKSIIAKGLLYNVGQYERDGEKYFYPNYSYNDLQSDPFISKEQVTDHSGANDEFYNIPYYNENIVTSTDNFDTSTASQHEVEVIKSNGDSGSATIRIPFNIDCTTIPSPFPGLSTPCCGNGYTDIFLIFNKTSSTTTDLSISPMWGGDYGNTGPKYFASGVLNIIYPETPIRIKVNVKHDVSLITGNPSPDYVVTSFYFILQESKSSSTRRIQIVSNGDTIAGSTTIVDPSGPITFCSIVTQDVSIEREIISNEGDGITSVEDKNIYESNIKGNKKLTGFSDKDISAKRFVFFSPDTSFVNPSLGGFLKVESVKYGKAKAYLGRIEDEPKYTINTSLTTKYAITLALYSIITGGNSGGIGGLMGKILNFFGGGSNGVSQSYADFANTFTSALDMISKLVPFKQYGYQYLSVGDYNNERILTSEDEGNIIRNLDISSYLQPGMTTVNDIYPINNYQRESSVYLKTSENLPYPHEYSGVPLDNSKFTFRSYLLETGVDLEENERVYRDISSLYGSIKIDNIDQYGDIYSYRSMTTGPTIYLDYSQKNKRINTIFGGDTFINRFGLKRKLPFFLTNTVGQSNNTDIGYNELGNVGYPTYWLSTYPVEAIMSDRTQSRLNSVINSMDSIADLFKSFLTFGLSTSLPMLRFMFSFGEDVLKIMGKKNINFDKYKSQGISEEGAFYLFSYGIPYFFVESDVNVDYRQAGNNLDHNYYPNVGLDIPNFWLQEKNVSILKDNYYLYNRDFSKQNLENYFKELDRDFDPLSSNIDYHTTRVIYSQPSNLEELQNNWLVYKANDYYDFPLINGELVDLNPLEQGKVLARFNNSMAVYNAFIQLETDNKTAITGGGVLFSNPPLQYNNVATGYAGTQHKAFTTTKFGSFWIDAERGEILQLTNNGINEISKNGKRNWFKENSWFRIKKYFPDYNIDNNFKDVGMTLIWDNRFNRLIITKRDYIPKDENIFYNISDSNFYSNNKIISIEDERYFDNASWTIGYSPVTESWISYYSFIPNYYVEQQNYFQSGIQGGAIDSSVWNHLLTNKSYQIFYNKFYNFEIEAITKTDFNSKILSAINYRNEVLRYTNNYDWKYMKNITFNQCIIDNTRQTSGLLNLEVNDKNNLSKGLTEILTGNSISIPISQLDDIWRFNKFSDVTKDPDSINPLFIFNSSNAYKELNLDAIDYKKPFNMLKRERLKSDWFKIRLINSTHSRYKFIFKSLLTKEIKQIR